MLTRFRNSAYLMAYAVATIPLWHYIRDGRLLALMVVVVAFAYLMIVLSTVQAAQPILSSEKAKTSLPRWLPDQPKYHHWWMLVRHSLKWHLLLIPPKMGLSLGFVEKLYNSQIQGLLFGYVYNYNDYSTHDKFPILYPQWETLSISLVAILFFAICETSLLAAIAIVANSMKRFLQICVLATIIRMGVIFIFVGLGVAIFYPIEANILPYSHYCRPTPVRENGIVVYADEENRIYLERIQDSRCNFKRLIDTTYISLMTPYDQGTLLAANIMRPWGKITYTDIESRRTNGNDNIWDNRPFVARQIVAGILGLMLYAGATWVVLWFIEDDE